MGAVGFHAYPMMNAYAGWFEPISGRINVEWLSPEEVKVRHDKLVAEGQKRTFQMVNGIVVEANVDDLNAISERV